MENKILTELNKEDATELQDATIKFFDENQGLLFNIIINYCESTYDDEEYLIANLTGLDSEIVSEFWTNYIHEDESDFKPYKIKKEHANKIKIAIVKFAIKGVGV